MTPSPSKDEIFEKVKSIMVELFELDAQSIRLESRLNEDLGLDSIDAIDFITYLQTYVGQRLQPEEFRSVRTIEDVVRAAELTIQQVGLPSQTHAEPGA